MAPRAEDSISVDTPDGRTITGHPEAVRQMLAAMERDQERRKHWPLTAGGDIDTRRAMTVLAQSFPTLRDADGAAPWDTDRFWNSETDWREVARELGLEGADKLTRFDLFEAMGVWDLEHVSACRHWMEWPFWP